MRILIRGGTVVTATGSSAADVLIDGETVVALLDPAHTGSFAGLADRSIDATGKYVVPGGIDVHTHLDMPFGGTFSADDFETGTRAAAWGGTTSLVDFAVQPKGSSLRETLDTWHAKAEGKARTGGGGHGPCDPAGPGRRRSAVHRPPERSAGAPGGHRGPRRRPQRLRRDLPPIPVPVPG